MTADYAFDLNLEALHSGPAASWEELLHVALLLRAMERAVDGIVLDGRDGWLLKHITRDGGRRYVQVRMPLSVAQAEWRENAPPGALPPLKLNLGPKT